MEAASDARLGANVPTAHSSASGACLLRVEVLHQLHRALDIGEQRSDRLAFALGDGLRISFRYDAHRLKCWRFAGVRTTCRHAQWGGAFAAELRGRSILETASCAAPLKGRCTLVAKFETLWMFGTAA